MGNLLYEKMNWEQVEGIIYSDTKQPFEILGTHVTEDGVKICCFVPDAVSVSVKEKKTGKTHEMQKLDDAGFFGVLVPGKKAFAYTRVASYADGSVVETEDPYAFLPDISSGDLELFEEGIHYEIYQILGAHKKTLNGVEGTMFAVWAPNAMRVSVVGDFNFWDGRRHIMQMIGNSGIFALFIPGIGEGTLYKYEIRVKGGAAVLKSDPYASYSQKRPENASVVFDISGYTWKDGNYMAAREKKDLLNSPINIYEVHLGSWKKPAEEEGSFYNYREMAAMLAAYVKEMGYTHIELMPVMEYPFDGSWGYQVTGYYAPTSRYGTPEDFMYFVDYMHQKGIGVILDWVPAHFPKDAFGLARFDGTCLYEHRDKRQGEHPHWGTLIYNYARPQVSNFLIANALYWVEQFHADGIRMDAVASMLYLDYGKQTGGWVANKYGGRENLDAMEMLKHLNSIMSKRNKNVLMIAEESTAWPMVSGNVESGGLGFTLKWNMGWMNDFLQYMRQDPLFRKGVHGCLTFSMMYAYSERFLLVFSHDEVVHGKGSLINKMPGEYGMKFANLRTAYGFMCGHPGKKLLFMGQDFGQFAEWNENKSLDWGLVEKYEMHRKLQQYCKDLNHLYCTEPSLYEQDFKPEGFTWMSCMDADHSIVSFVRQGREEDDLLLFVCNFTPVVYENFQQAVPRAGKYKEILNSDSEKYGGSNMVNTRVLTAKEVPQDGQEYSVEMVLPPLAVTIFRYKPEPVRKAKLEEAGQGAGKASKATKAAAGKASKTAKAAASKAAKAEKEAVVTEKAVKEPKAAKTAKAAAEAVQDNDAAAAEKAAEKTVKVSKTAKAGKAEKETAVTVKEPKAAKTAKAAKKPDEKGSAAEESAAKSTRKKKEK